VTTARPPPASAGIHPLPDRLAATAMLTTFIYSLLALDKTLAALALQYGPWLYGLLFVVIFAETGLVVFPFLPGD
jgi:membrane-associated protein